MKNTLLILVASICILSFGDKSFGSVIIDDFSAGSSSLVDSGDVARRLSLGASDNGSGITFDSGLSLVSYRVRRSGGARRTFGDLGDFSQGLAFSTSSVDSGAAFVFGLIGNGNLLETQVAGDSGLTFSTDVSDFRRITLVALGLGGDASVGGSFSAVPEPTSLVLVGLACGLVGVRRKKLA